MQLGQQKVVVELKAVSSELGECEEKQLRNYMKILGIECGLLINFQTPGRKQGKTCSKFVRLRERLDFVLRFRPAADCPVLAVIPSSTAFKIFITGLVTTEYIASPILP